MIQTEGSKLIFNRLTQEVWLYDLESDPEEQRDLSAYAPNTVAALRGQLERYMRGEERAAQLQPMPPEELEQMKALGYID